MSHADTSLASVKPRIDPWRPITTASSGSVAVKRESRLRPIGWPGPAQRAAEALKNSSGRSAS